MTTAAAGSGEERGASGAGFPARVGAPLASGEVREALAAGRPVVALESSVFAQGLPIPHNREAAHRMSEAIRGAGAVPAVTAVLAGTARIGLDADAMELLLRRDTVAKVSARDLPLAMIRGENGATTVAATLAIARAARVAVFATGGIGGVHREPPFDESADLQELARTPMVVICAGAKAILDLPATFERLESLGVTVIGFRTDEVPGFFSRGSGIRLSARIETAAEAAGIYRSARAIGLTGALLVLNPPPEHAALPRDQVNRAVEEALAQARDAGVVGAAITPFLLSAVERATGGASRQANLALLESNAALAAQIAAAICAQT